MSRIEQEQIRNSREYQDQLSSGSLAESGVDLQSDLNHVFSSIRRIIYGNTSGVGKWYNSVPKSLSDIQIGSGFINTITEVFNNGSGILNGSSFDFNINLGQSTKFLLNDSNSNVYTVSDTENRIKRLGRRVFFSSSSKIRPLSIINIPNGATYTIGDFEFRNLQVLRNGITLIPIQDYNETSPSGIQIKFKLSKKETLEFRILG